ncbi:MAG TPA: OB-fold domain-containing protein [Myxococcota bacterium]|nr:OB-fold domain-containing protein [Myxococcota bacterium]
MDDREELRADLDAWIGREGDPQLARDPVNPAMIRHWCDAVGDYNPVYTDPDFAAKSVHGALVAPPAMLQAWTMRGLRPPEDASARPAPFTEVMRLLDAAGYTSVVATNCRQEYRRYLREGDLLSVTTRVAAVSDEKKTALGVGRFVDEEMIYRDAAGEEVARMTFRLLKFKPPVSRADAQAKAPAAAAPARRRPRPAQSRDNAFFWEGVAAGELRIQRCAGCKVLRHPPGPMCPHCHSLDWDTVTASGRGHVYSYVVAHHPPVPPFSYPNAIALIELDEGTRLVSNLVGIDPGDIAIGLRVRVEFTRVDEDLVLPLFRPDPF